MRGLATWVTALALAAALPAAAAGVAEIIDGRTLALDDGTVARLAGIGLPGRDEAARRALLALLDGRGVVLEPAAPPSDRHGRALVQATREDGLWIQGELLRRGLALVATRPEARSRAAEMLAIEAEARAAGRGLWADAANAVRAPDRVESGGFRVVEGRVAAAARVRGSVYLNFGDDWRTDFTVAIAAAQLGAFRAAGVDALKLAGATVRVRGWVRDYNGPLLDADHPEQIEILRPR